MNKTILAALATLGLLCSANAQRLHNQGETPTFSYELEEPDSDFFLVAPGNDATTAPIAVSRSFLELVMREAPISDEEKLKLLTQYPQIMNGIYQEKMEAHYPDARVEYDSPFEPYSAEGIEIRQDPLAAPYVLVSLRQPDGTLKTFSLCRDIVDSVLASNNLPTDKVFSALEEFPYRLPERARPVFNQLAAEDIFALAEEDVPGIQKQEFVKARNKAIERNQLQSTTKTTKLTLKGPEPRRLQAAKPVTNAIRPHTYPLVEDIKSQTARQQIAPIEIPPPASSSVQLRGLVLPGVLILLSLGLMAWAARLTALKKE